MLSTVNSNLSCNTNFRSKSRLVGIEKTPDYEVREYETEASTGKKWGVGLASYFITGLGQAINGDWGKAAAFFGAGLGFSGLTLGGYFKCTKSNFKELINNLKNSSELKPLKNNNKAGKIMLGVGILGGLVTGIWSIVDAVKSAKSTTKQIIPTNQSFSKQA